MHRFTIHGARGGIPVSGKEYLEYGGSTTCFSLATDEGVLVFDAGTGLSFLSNKPDGPKPPVVTVLFTHFHMDHLIGLPFFDPFYMQDAEVTLMGDARRDDDWKRVLSVFVGEPYWPIGLDKFPATVRLTDLPHDRGLLEIYGARISWCPVWHPQQCLAYRIEIPQASIVIATDHEPGNEQFDTPFQEFCRDADFLIYDAEYLPEEYPAHRGWGHGTWEDGVATAKKSGAKELILTHHDKLRRDDQIDEMLDRARAVFPATKAASENLVLTE